MRFVYSCLACSWWLCSGCCCGHGSSDGSSHSLLCSDPTQGEVPPTWLYSCANHVIALILRRSLPPCVLGSCSFRLGLLSDAHRPGEEVHSGTFTGLFSCITHSCHCFLLHFKGSKKAHKTSDISQKTKLTQCQLFGLVVFVSTVQQFSSEPAQCNRCGNALLCRDLSLRGYSACSSRNQQQQDKSTLIRPPPARWSRDAPAAAPPGAPGEPHTHLWGRAPDGAGSWAARRLRKERRGS